MPEIFKSDPDLPGSQSSPAVIIVGDIGSTKSSWHISGNIHRHITLPGYNPVVHSIDTGRKMVEALLEEARDQMISELWYYGAGVLDLKSADGIRQLLATSFPQTKLHISNDLEGAAKAACGDMPGTIAILGTGSHAAVYDGDHIVRQANALGYILGDEGGGSDIGKSLVQAYFYYTMPEIIRVEMKKVIAGNRTDFLQTLYTSPTPNQFLAGIAKVSSGFYDHPWMMQLISERFDLFIRRHVLPLSPDGPVHVLGSIGCIFTDLMKQQLKVHGLMPGQFIRDPSFPLFEMHIQHGD
jgi:hypothetical protein